MSNGNAQSPVTHASNPRPTRRPAVREANSRPQPTGQVTAPPKPQEKPPVQRRPQEKVGLGPIKELLVSKLDAIGSVIPKGSTFNAKGIVNNALRLIWNDNLLKMCTPASVLDAVLAAAATGLDFVGDQAMLLPYSFKVEDPQTKEKVHDHYEARFTPGYKGYITVAGRHGYVMDCQHVCEKDPIEVRLGTENVIIHTPGFRDRGKMVGAYCVVRDKSGHVVHIAIIYENEIELIIQRTPAWRAYPGEMLSKTACKRAFKWLPKTDQTMLLIDEIDKRFDESGDPHDLLDPENRKPQDPPQQ